MITLRVFHLKTFAAILTDTEEGTDYLWDSPYDLTNLYSTDPLNIEDSIISFGSWEEAQAYLVGARMATASLQIVNLECKAEMSGSKGLSPTESRRMLVMHVIDKILPVRGFQEALLFVSSIKAFYEPDEAEKKLLQEAFESCEGVDHSRMESLARLSAILNAHEFDAAFKIEQAMSYVNNVLLPEGRIQDVKSVAFHVIKKNHAKTPKLVIEAERLYKVSKQAYAALQKERAASQPDFQRGMPTTPKRRIL